MSDYSNLYGSFHTLADIKELHVQWRNNECVLHLDDSEESIEVLLDFLRKHDSERFHYYLIPNRDFSIVVSPTGKKRFSGHLRYQVEIQYSNGESKPLDFGTPDNLISYLLILLFQKTVGGFCNKHMEKRETSAIISKLYDIIYGGGQGGEYWISQKSKRNELGAFDHHGINQCMTNLHAALKRMRHLTKAEREACEIIKEKKTLPNSQTLSIRTVNIPSERILIQDSQLLAIASQIPTLSELSSCKRRA